MDEEVEKIVMAAKMRDLIVFMLMRRTTTVVMTLVPFRNTAKESRHVCEILVSGKCHLCLDERSTLGGHPYGDCLALSESCPDLIRGLEAEDGRLNFQTQSGERVSDQQEILGRDFAAGAPIDDGGCSDAGNTGGLCRTTQGFDNGVD